MVLGDDSGKAAALVEAIFDAWEEDLADMDLDISVTRAEAKRLAVEAVHGFLAGYDAAPGLLTK